MKKSDSEFQSRELWNKKREFLLACIGYAVGLGNVWRFPYLCFKSGGGAFMIPYFTMLVLCGIPLLYMEMAIGQYTRHGPIKAFASMCPLMKGVGLATIVISFILCTYYNVIITWALYYFFNTFQSTLPWSSCSSWWNSDNCQFFLNKSLNNTLNVISSTQDFFDKKVLNKTGGIEDMGTFKWDTFLCFVLAWILCYFCVFKGIRSAGKVVYFTATFPYVLLIALLIGSVTLPGANDGIYYFVRPVWSELLNVQVWIKAAAQVFNSIGIAFGSIIAFSSYNKRDNGLLKDTLLISSINSGTSLLAGFVVFSAMGHMSNQLNLPIENVTQQGPELVFITYPQIFSNLPAPHFWAFAFFLMLICLGIDSQFAMVEVVNTCLAEAFNGKLVTIVFKKKEFLVLAVCVAAFLLGLPNLMQGGIYVFTLLDHYTAVVALMFIAFFEIITVAWLYGSFRLAYNVKQMTGETPSYYFIICWLICAPLLVGVILIFSIINYEPAKYDDYTYPIWANAFGWLIAICSMICIPVAASFKLCSLSGPFLKRLKLSIIPIDNSMSEIDDQSVAVELINVEHPPDYTSATTI